MVLTIMKQINNVILVMLDAYHATLLPAFKAVTQILLTVLIIAHLLFSASQDTTLILLIIHASQNAKV